MQKILLIKHCCFVFGSNTLGINGKGAALTAKILFGAIDGVGKGLSGGAYAIPTKHNPYTKMKLDDIQCNVNEFICFSTRHAEITFLVTRVACGLAGWYDYDIAPMFKSAPSNCILPAVWNINNGNIGHHIESITKEDMDKEIW